MNYLLLTNALFFVFFFLAWRSDNLLDIFMKTSMLALSTANVVAIWPWLVSLFR